MWRLYQQTPCYTKVAKKVRRDPATVSKYVKEYEAAVRAAGLCFMQSNEILRGEIEMAFFSLSATCGVCGREVGWNRYKIAMDNAWCCSECLKKAQKNGNCAVFVNQINIDGLKKLIDGGMEAFKENKEYRKRCNVCGHIFCYTDSDIYRNKQLARQAQSSANMAVLEAIGGTRLASNQQSAAANSALDKIIDYSKCPNCNSTNLSDATAVEVQQVANGNGSPIISTADELKKFKELLDMGIITQEEFDAQKSQLLSRNSTTTQAVQPQQRTVTATQTQTVSNITHAKPGTWNCSCGRNHPNYVSSCVCGVSKSDIKR